MAKFDSSALSFSYNISRKYPYKWLTPVVVVFGIIAVILLSFLNLGASGYTLESTYRTDPNATVAQDQHYDRFSNLFIGGVKATCEPTPIIVNSQFTTNNSALTYTLTSVTQEQEEGQKTITLGSLVYYNNLFEDCNITSVVINIQGITRTAGLVGQQRWGVDVQAEVVCTIAQGSTTVTMVADYNLQQQAIYLSSGFKFIGRNRTSQASLFWGESLLSAYWLDLSNMMYYDSYTYISAWIRLTNNKPNPKEVDITDPKYFDGVGCFFVPFNDSVALQGGPPIYYCLNEYLVPELSRGLAYGVPSDVWYPSDSLSKSMQSTILTDLGQSSSRYQNILIDAKLLKYFTSNISSINNQSFVDQNIRMDPSLALVSFDDFYSVNTTGPLEVSPSVISTNYLCQVPKRKSTGSLIVSILAADLVFLQALWQIFKLCMDKVQVTKDPRANYCEGCAELLGSDHEDEDQKSLNRPSKVGERLRHRHSRLVSVENIEDSSRSELDIESSGREDPPNSHSRKLFGRAEEYELIDSPSRH